ncbi:MAG: DNA mismatch repair endonuclease MutL, partial [Candidatus Binatia bacterium]
MPSPSMADGLPSRSVAAGAAARIALLDPDTVAGIAAGEVVERPASAVKELVENALDAGATRVRVDYEDSGGRTRLVITDDGCGIADEQIELALTRHATSKIRRLSDLESVATFGFRGEALAAIASASDLELLTAVEGSTGGTRVVVRGGRIVERAPSPSRRGTRIDVQDLFASMPARRKFLKNTSTEAGYVTDVMRRFALARPDVHFVLAIAGRLTLDVAPVAGGAERIRQVFGREVAASLVEVDARYGNLRLHGHVSAPGTAYGSSRRMAIFVGGRWVRERLLFQAVLEGYQTYLLKGRFPAVSLFLEHDAGTVDVNVHPAKLEVRFSDPDRVRGFVAEAVRDALRRSASPLGRWGIDASESLRRRAVPASGYGAVNPLPRRGTLAEAPAPRHPASPGDGVADANTGAAVAEGEATGS